MLSREFAPSVAEAEASSWRSHADEGTQARLDDDTFQEDLEFIEHDAAHGVFRSPRPSITLSELQQQQLRENLLVEGATKEEDEDAVCKKVWSSHPSHTRLRSDKDRVKSFDLAFEDNNPWRLVHNQTDSCRHLGKRGDHTVCPPLFGLISNLAEEQNTWGDDDAEHQQKVRHVVESDVDSEWSDDAGFEMLDYPI